MKKLIGFSLLMCSLIGLSSCGDDSTSTTSTTETPTPSTSTTPSTTTTPSTSTTVEKVALTAPVITLTADTVSWEAVSNATSYVVSVNNSEVTQTTTSYTLTTTEVGSYDIKVKALPSNTELYLESAYSNTVTYTVNPIVMESTKLYVVGDSTVCSFNDSTYYYPRYGYGTQLGTVLNSKVEVVNLALSGKSSLSFITEDNYTTLTSSISEGDYLMIGFGHNDEKSDDPTRYSEPLGSKETAGSFKYNLYEHYIKIATEKGATPILCTPIVRANLNNDYTSSSGHVTNGADYANVIVELGQETSTTVLNLRDKTKALYSEIGYSEAIKYHAWTNSKSQSVDTTHLNVYGAKMVAYLLANELSSTTSTLKNFLSTDITMPTVADLVVNPSYVEPTYESPDLASYEAPTQFQNTTEGWYGTAFGDTGGNPSSTASGYLAHETSTGVFEVGQALESSNKGKITSTEGIAFLFRQISKTKNFKMTVTAEVTREKDTTQAGFGIMLRDDVYINQTTTNNTIKSNYVAAGMYLTSGTTNVNYSRVNETLTPSGTKVTGLYQTGDTATFTIERIGQVVNITTVYKGETYTQTYTDFDFVAIDNDYMYLGMYATRGTVVNFTNVDFQITGDAIAA